jgi:hypothetical protein
MNAGTTIYRIADWWKSECDVEESRAEEDYMEDEKMSIADSALDAILEFLNVPWYECGTLWFRRICMYPRTQRKSGIHTFALA